MVENLPPPRVAECDLRTLQHIPRWGIMRVRKQNVAEHSFYVALYAAQIADMISWHKDRGALLEWALCHDVEEVFTGDATGPYKKLVYDKDKGRSYANREVMRRFGNSLVGSMLFDGTDEPPDDVFMEIKRIVKAADMLDEALHLCDEIAVGNYTVKEVLDKNVLGRLEGAWRELPGDQGENMGIWRTEIQAVLYAHQNHLTPHLPLSI